MNKECALNLMREHLIKLQSNPNVYEDGMCTVIYAMEAVIIPMLEKAVEQDRANMTLSEVLLHKTKVGDLVLIEDCGWQIGCTIIDHEDLFIRSLDENMLSRKVVSFLYEKRDWTTKNVMVVNI
jgi:hypothetical protein